MRVSLVEAVEIFSPTLVDVLAEKKSSLKDQLVEIKSEIRKNKDNDYFLEVMDKHDVPLAKRDIYFELYRLSNTTLEDLNEKRSRILSELNNITRAETVIEFRKKGNLDKLLDTDSAKDVPIENVFPGKVKKTGSNLIAKCPFHKDTNPSFTIYPKSNSFYCFSCNEGGDVIRFIMLYEDMGFVEAVKYLST